MTSNQSSPAGWELMNPAFQRAALQQHGHILSESCVNYIYMKMSFILATHILKLMMLTGVVTGLLPQSCSEVWLPQSAAQTLPGSCCLVSSAWRAGTHPGVAHPFLWGSAAALQQPRVSGAQGVSLGVTAHPGLTAHPGCHCHPAGLGGHLRAAGICNAPRAARFAVPSKTPGKDIPSWAL